MNELDTLRELRADVPPMSARAEHRGQARLTAAMAAGERPSWRALRSRTARPSRGLRVAVSGLVATAAAAVTTVVLVAAPGGEAPAQAADVLHRAAAAAAAPQGGPEPRPDQYIFQERAHHLQFGTGPGTNTRSWQSVDGTRPGRSGSAGPSTPCASPYVAPTRAAGNAEPAPVAGGVSAPALRVHTVVPVTCPVEWIFKPYRAKDGLTDAPYAVLATLPTEPGALLERLTADPAADMASPEAGLSREVQVWSIVRSMAGNLPPAQRAALFRAAASLAGIRVHDTFTDAAGRPGIGVGLDDPRIGHVVLIFDRSTYEYLGETVQGPDGAARFGTALLRTAVVDAMGQLPS